MLGSRTYDRPRVMSEDIIPGLSSVSYGHGTALAHPFRGLFTFSDVWNPDDASQRTVIRTAAMSTDPDDVSSFDDVEDIPTPAFRRGQYDGARRLALLLTRGLPPDMRITCWRRILARRPPTDFTIYPVQVQTT